MHLKTTAVLYLCAESFFLSFAWFLLVLITVFHSKFNIFQFVQGIAKLYTAIFDCNFIASSVRLPCYISLSVRLYLLSMSSLCVLLNVIIENKT